MGKKKKDCLFHVDGFEEWMDQFCSDSCRNFSFPNQIHIDLCETEQKMKTGLNICILHKNISLQRIIPLPDNIIYKKMLACLENGYLAIHISKNEVADKHEKQVLFSNQELI